MGYKHEYCGGHVSAQSLVVTCPPRLIYAMYLDTRTTSQPTSGAYRLHGGQAM